MNNLKHQCACGMEFIQKKNLYAHMRKQHNIEPLKPRRNRNYECDYCGSKFTWQSSIIKHIRNIHSDETNKLIGNNNKKISLICPYGSCVQYFRNYAVLRQHLAEKHDFIVEYEELSFSSIEDFDRWKDNIQLATASLYTRSTAARTLKIESGQRFYYNCHRSNIYTHRGKNIRAIKSIGSNKIGKACPSRLEVTYTEYLGQTIISVKYWKTHCGHTNEMERLPLNRQIKCLIAEKLEKGYSLKQIVDWVRDSEQDEGVSRRLQLVSQKDLYNIIRDFNIKHATRKQNTKLNNNLKVNKNLNGIDKKCKKNNTSVANYSKNNTIPIIEDSRNNIITTDDSKSNEFTTHENNIFTTNVTKNHISTTNDGLVEKAEKLLNLVKAVSLSYEDSIDMQEQIDRLIRKAKLSNLDSLSKLVSERVQNQVCGNTEPSEDLTITIEKI